MKFLRFVARSAFGALLAAAAISPREAAASIHNCEHPSLLAEDEVRLFAAVRVVLPPHLEPMLADRCRWSDSAFAWITTAKVTEQSGVTHWWMSSCARDVYRWTCDPAVFQQQFETSFVAGDLPRNVKISFGAKTDLPTARRLASEALALYANSTPTIPYCGSAEDSESRWRASRERHPLPTAQEELHITVDREKMRMAVWFGDLVHPDDVQIGIDFPVPDAQHAGPCWIARQQ
jgi:hypothetical protein